MAAKVTASKDGKKDIKKIRSNKSLATKFQLWKARIEAQGVQNYRQVYGKGYSDHPLTGNKAGRHSAHLIGKWVVEYVVTEQCDDTNRVIIEIVTVMEVHPHDY